MVNGNYVLYGDRPSSESEIVDDHVHTKTAERKVRRKPHRTANELQSTLNLAQLDNDTDSVKYEKSVKEPRLLRYVPTTDVEENFVSEKFETYDLKPTEERPRRYAFTKKPKNPADGSVNYAYSRSSSSCSSPNGNLPTISEHLEQYGTYRVRPLSGGPVPDVMTGYESKLDKYFAKPREITKLAAKQGSHPDSLYRVPTGSGGGGSKMARTLQVLRWPAALLLVCLALAVFVYFLMPDNIETGVEAGMESGAESVNGTYWDPVAATVGAQTHRAALSPEKRPAKNPSEHKNKTEPQGTKTTEIDFYNAESDKPSFAVPEKEPDAKIKLPIPPVFPTHLTPEVQYGNEKADTDKLRNPKFIEESNAVPVDSTLKPHITQKPEKPLQVYFKDGNGVMSTTTHYSTETIVKAETLNDFTNYGEKVAAKKSEGSTKGPVSKPLDFEREPEIPSEIQEFYHRRHPAIVDVNFTSGHSKLFGISIEDAEKMKATTQSSTYNTRVSPTLPTWRDGDDATTKKYPVNVNYDVPICRSTRLAFCRGVLPYDLAGPEVTLNGVAALELLPQVEYLVATNCSERVRQFMCALLEPECSPPPFPPKMPCYNICKAITDSCEGLIPRDLAPAFNCNQYSSSNCVSAKSPCFPREFPCGDGSCVPRDWICDGAQDCSAGEDEVKCVTCEDSEYRCQSGGCILKQWMCDGYSDCPSGEDESVNICETYGVSGAHAAVKTRDPVHESAGSAPAASTRRQNRVPPPLKTARHNNQKIGDNESSKEILMTSDSSNVLRRNYTRRPSLSRLMPYTRPALQEQRHKLQETPKPNKPVSHFSRYSQSDKKKLNAQTPKPESVEDVNVGDLGFFEDIDKEIPEKKQPQNPPSQVRTFGGVPTGPEPELTHLDKSINKLEKVIDGASLLRKALAQQEIADSPETNSTVIEKDFEFATAPAPPSQGFSAPSNSARASPCPSGELRCVDGRCITLSQLCDGTIDCTDHADEDNCYT